MTPYIAVTSPIEKVRTFIEKHALLQCEGIVVAVSGGPDSMALLDILVRLADDLPKRLRIHIAHLNHLLRADESDSDASFVKAIAERLRLGSTIKSINVREAAAARSEGIEEAARRIRYRFLWDVARDVGAERIAVGHTMTDQAETFLMRLARGAGLRGLSAMRPITKLAIFDADGSEPADSFETNDGCATESSDSRQSRSSGPLLIRPLLCITREEVEAHCRERGLAFRVDSSNRELAYTRNRVRASVVPALAEINPQMVRAIARTAEHLARDQDVLDALAWSRLEAARLSGAFGQIEAIQRYSLRLLQAEPEGLQRRMIAEALRQSEIDEEITEVHVSAVQSLIKTGISGNRITLPGGLKVWREFDSLMFETEQANGDYEEKILQGEKAETEFGNFKLTLERGVNGDNFSRIVTQARTERIRTSLDWLIVAVDDSALPSRLIVRTRRPGELAGVVGHRQTIKLKKLMIDHKIPGSRRNSWPILVTPDGDYIWSPGLPPSLRFSANDKTDRLAILRALFI